MLTILKIIFLFISSSQSAVLIKRESSTEISGDFELKGMSSNFIIIILPEFVFFEKTSRTL